MRKVNIMDSTPLISPNVSIIFFIKVSPL